MQIVIDIDEDTYRYMQSRCKYQNKGDKGLSKFEEAGVAIKNGTPLPKGHGRLGDLDVLEREMVNGIKAGNYEDGYESFAHINNMDDCVECVKCTDTIIEADAEREG